MADNRLREDMAELSGGTPSKWTWRGLLIRCALLILLLFVIDRAIYTGLSVWYERMGFGSSGEGVLWAAIHSDADVIVVGHSRARHNYDTEILEACMGKSVFNIGENGQGIWYKRAAIDIILRERQRLGRTAPDLFIINVDARSLTYNRRKHEAVMSVAPFIDRSPVARDIVLGVSPVMRFLYVSKAFRFNSKLLLMVGTTAEREPAGSGFVPHSRVFDPSIEEDAEEGYARFDLEYDENIGDLLRETLRSIHESGSRAVLVTSPLWRRDGIVDPMYTPYFERIQEMVDEFGFRRLHISIENTPIFQDPSLYMNATHLNRGGARLFTEILCDRLGE